MRLVIDMQGAQTPGSRHRGIGRYTMALVEDLLRQREEGDSVYLLLNGRYTEAIDEIEARFGEILPREAFITWYPPGPLSWLEDSRGRDREAAAVLRAHAIAALEPDILLISSLFEGFDSDALTDIPPQRSYSVAVILYDLIPLLHASIYLANPSVEAWYRDRLAQLAHADVLLAISRSSGEEAIERLGIDPGKVHTIHSAADPQLFHPCTLEPGHRQALRERYALDAPFVMYTGGIDPRKNVEGLIEAFALLPEEIRRRYRLALVCAIRPEQEAALAALAEKNGLEPGTLVCTGYVPDEDLVALYNLCDLFVFPSWHEGFGLPLLEAMLCGAPALAADRASLPEILPDPEALFDPFDSGQMATKIRKAIGDKGFKERLLQNARKYSRAFSWERTARKSWQALRSRAAASPLSDGTRQRYSGERPKKLAFLSPLPPQRSGISDYSAQLLPALARFYEIELIMEDPESRLPKKLQAFTRRSIAYFRENFLEYDRVVYQFGNSTYHAHMFSLLREFPGTVVLHDFFLSGVLAYIDGTMERAGIFESYLRQSHGGEALRRLEEKGVGDVAWEYPANYPVLRDAYGVIVHSPHALDLARSYYGTDRGMELAPLVRIPAHPLPKAEARRRLGLDPDLFIVATFGHIAPTKLHHRLLEASLRSPLAGRSDFRLAFVGEASAAEYAAGLVREAQEHLGPGRLLMSGWNDEERYRLWLDAVDIAVQLRTDTRGETSAAVLDCMNHALPTIVNAHGAMAYLPDEAVLKIPDRFEASELGEAIEALAEDWAYAEALGAEAARHIAAHHSPEACALRYREAIESFYRQAGLGVDGAVRELASLSAVCDGRSHESLVRALAATFAPLVGPREPL